MKQERSHWTRSTEMKWSYTGVRRVEAAGEVVRFADRETTHGDVKSRLMFVERIWKTDYWWTDTLRHSRRTQDVHMNWHPSVRGPRVKLNAGMECICVVSLWKTQMGYPCSRSLSFKAYDHRLALQAAFRHLFNLGLLSPSFSRHLDWKQPLCLPLPRF